jgi:hypothetical protein
VVTPDQRRWEETCGRRRRKSRCRAAKKQKSKLAIQCKNDGDKELEELGELQELLDKVSITMEGDEKQWELTS